MPRCRDGDQSGTTGKDGRKGKGVDPCVRPEGSDLFLWRIEQKDECEVIHRSARSSGTRPSSASACSSSTRGSDGRAFRFEREAGREH